MPNDFQAIEQKSSRFVPQEGAVGGGTGDHWNMFSPNTDEESMTYQQALSRLNSSNHAAFKSISRDVMNAAHLDPAQVQQFDAVGDWEGGSAENSMVHVLHNVDPSTSQYLAAWHGLLANQKAVLNFVADPGGKDSLYQMFLPVASGDELRRTLDQYQIHNRTIIPRAGGHVVLFWDEGRRLRPNFEKLAEKYDATVREAPGTGKLIGDTTGFTRTGARRAYRQVIRAYEARAASAASQSQPAGPRQTSTNPVRQSAKHSNGRNHARSVKKKVRLSAEGDRPHVVHTVEVPPSALFPGYKPPPLELHQNPPMGKVKTWAARISKGTKGLSNVLKGIRSRSGDLYVWSNEDREHEVHHAQVRKSGIGKLAYDTPQNARTFFYDSPSGELIEENDMGDILARYAAEQAPAGGAIGSDSLGRQGGQFQPKPRPKVPKVVKSKVVKPKAPPAQAPTSPSPPQQMAQPSLLGDAPVVQPLPKPKVLWEPPQDVGDLHRKYKLIDYKTSDIHATSNDPSVRNAVKHFDALLVSQLRENHKHLTGESLDRAYALAHDTLGRLSGTGLRLAADHIGGLSVFPSISGIRKEFTKLTGIGLKQHHTLAFVNGADHRLYAPVFSGLYTEFGQRFKAPELWHHEIGHLVDQVHSTRESDGRWKRTYRFSQGSEWKDAWDMEISKPLMLNKAPVISSYAGVNPAEGFAEVHRAILSHDPKRFEILKDKCPQIVAFLSKNGLLPDAPPFRNL